MLIMMMMMIMLVMMMMMMLMLVFFFPKLNTCSYRCGAEQETIAMSSSRRDVHLLCRLSVCRTEVRVETTAVVDTHEGTNTT